MHDPHHHRGGDRRGSSHCLEPEDDVRASGDDRPYPGWCCAFRSCRPRRGWRSTRGEPGEPRWRAASERRSRLLSPSPGHWHRRFGPSGHHDRRRAQRSEPPNRGAPRTTAWRCRFRSGHQGRRPRSGPPELLQEQGCSASRHRRRRAVPDARCGAGRSELRPPWREHRACCDGNPPRDRGACGHHRGGGR